MKRISSLFAAALCAAAVGIARADDGLTMADFGHSIKLMVNGYTGTETLTNFPVLVRLSETGIPGFRYDDLTNNKGKDIAFFDAAGNHLASEIQTNDWTTSGTSLIWVSLPRMQQGTKFYLCYDTSDSGVFVTNQNPWAEYVGVWHLDESGGQNKPVIDSTTNQLHGVNSSTSGARTDGVVGYARKIATSNDHAAGIIVDTLSDPVKQAAADSLGTDFHASFWMRPQGDVQNNRRWSNLLGRRKGDKGESWGVTIDDDAKGLRIYADKTQTAKNDQQRFVSTFRDTGHGLTTAAIPPTISNQFPFLNTRGGAWQKIDVLWKYRTAGDSACYEVYSNGVLAAAGALIGPVSDVPANIGIGCSTQDTYGSSDANQKGRRFFGDMDEVRLRPGIVSADWIKADFDTMNNANFVTLAPLEVLEVMWAEEAGRTGVTNVAWNAAVVGGIVTGLGEGATEATVEGKFWADGETEPAVWTTLASGLGRPDAFEAVVPCAENTAYHYKLRAVDDANSETDPVSGTFTTPLGLAVAWGEASGRAGVTNVLGHLVVVGGSVGCLGGSATATVEGKFWENGQEEPPAWTALVANLAQTGDFSASVMGLEADTLYSYKLRVAGSNGNATEPVSGTFTTSHGLTVSWAGGAERPGVTNVAWNAAVVGGIVEALGDVGSCTIEGKFWTGETEPTAWDVLGAGVGQGAFSIRVPDLAENTTYSYKLRVTETDGSETPAASGAFTTPVGLAAVWADDVAGRPGVTAVGVLSATVGGSVECLGDSATCTVEGKFWTGDTEPSDWTTLGDALSQAGAFSATVPNLAGGTAYSYKLRLSGSNGVATEPVSGTFTTAPGLTVAWSTATASPGIVKVDYAYVSIGGQVTALGDATACSVEAKIWAAGESEPAGWTTIKDRLGLNGTFSVNIPDLEAGTTYSYRLRAVGDDGEETAPVSGAFTTLGSEGEEIGSPYTYFFDDGTNACWVAREFERFLPFTVTGYTGTETLTNFPVLVEVRKADTNGFSYDDFYHYDGSDIVFVDEKGHIIPHEIDTWNKNGMSLFWVRLPEMNNGTTFTMCYRSPLLEERPDPGNTFEPYVGVWHMNETHDGVDYLKDSSVNDFETETHAMSTADSNGRIGYARRVAQSPGSSSSFGRIIAFDHDDILRTGVGNVFTFSGWYKLAATPPKWAYLVSRKSEDADMGWGIQYDESATTRLRVWSGSSAKNMHQIFNTPGASATGWNYWTFIYDGSVNGDGTTNQLFHAYLNGQELSSTVGGFALNYPVVNDERAYYDHLVIGGQQNGTGAFNGLVDEARYSKGMRSADWIKAEYDSTLQQVNWNNAAKRFVTKGTVSRGTDSLVPVVVWERGNGLPDTILDVSYAYVQFAGTVTYCGAGADECRIEYQIWVDGEHRPEEWTTLASGLEAGQYFSIPVTGLKQDMLYNFSIRAVNMVEGQERQNHEHSGQFRTNGNMVLGEVDGELFRLGDRFVHRYRTGSWIFTSPDYVTNVEILVVGGGGAGGYKVGGGGGGGGVFHSLSFPVTTSTVYRIQVGKGGIAASNLTERSENGEISYFALADDEANPLIRMHGGGSGGSYVNNAAFAKGADGASGGGGTYAQDGGVQAMMGLPEEFRPFGNVGGRGNDTLTGGSIGKVAAGGGGGAGRAGLGATFDSWSAGGAGGVGVGSAISGETLFYGAGGGGGYIYRMANAEDGTVNFTKPGGGGSGIGGNAADVRNGTPATSGVPNTGAGGGGGSSKGKGDGKTVDESDTTYWQGGNGGDGVVLISYEAHGRDPISEEPRITMTSCDYTDEKGYADIAYRAYWAGIQSQTNDIYVLYSTVSEEDVLAGNGELVKVMHGSIGIDKTTFTPPAVGYTYWVRLVARKDANSFMYSDEVGTFEVPAIRLSGASWYMPAATDENNDPSQDYADVYYSLYDTDPDARLYCYWSENRADLEGDEAPTGANVHFLDLGTGKANHDGTFRIPGPEGLERDKVYYIRIATGNEAGTKYFLSKLIVELETIDKPRVIFPEATWENHRATIEFLLTTSILDPGTVDFYALYGPESTIKGNNPFGAEGVNAFDLGKCSAYPDDLETETQFPLWSSVETNLYMRLALVTNGVPVCYSQRSQYIEINRRVPPNTLLIYANADAKIGCYGDEPQPLTYECSYGGRTEGPGWDHWLSAGGSIIGALACAVSSLSPTGQYDIVQGTLGLSNGGQTFINEDPVLDSETGEPVLDPATGDPVTETTYYYYELVYTGSRYVVTNAQFTVTIADARTIYTGEDFNVTTLDTTVTGLRNDQPITYMYRVGTNDWTSTITTTYSDIWTHIIQFKATAPNHVEERGTFMITVDPAPLSAEISAADLPFTNAPQVPTVTTNVTGHIRPDLNPLTSEYRDEAGEWQSEVPSFTKPGTYKLFYRVSAPNHTSFTTNCTFTIEEWDYKVNMDGAAGYGTPINVSDPGWILDATGWTGEQFADRDARYAKLDEVQANGLRLWQNYVIERTDFGKKLVSTVVQSGDRVQENSFVVHFPGVVALRNTGLLVRYRVDSKLRRRNDTEFVPGELSDKYESNVPLGPEDPTGLYVFNIVLTPTNALYTGESVLASVSTVGVLRVSSALTNTVTAVPWLSMAVDSTNEIDVSVSDVVNPNGLSAGDEILAYDGADDVFHNWRQESGASWKAIATASIHGVSVADAKTSQFERGSAFWLVRSQPATPGADNPTNYFYLVGRYIGGGRTAAIEPARDDGSPSSTLCANPTGDAIALNDLAFSGPIHKDDTISFNGDGDVSTIYVRDAANQTWGYWKKTKVNGRIKSVFVSDGVVAPGTGFWYIRRSKEGLTLQWPGWEE